MSGHVINLNLRIELVHGIIESQSSKSKPEELASVSPSKTREENVDKNCPATKNSEDSESIDDVKEQLRQAELGCVRLEKLYKKYRLCWLEENYHANILEEYAPSAVNTTSPGQITWDAPSSIQSDEEFEDLSTDKIP
ncbi:hypothetical protein P692DRAFT_201810716 [Suillus brevipes Sb2]|nr:hypothetical protein P692DRAFT_201810716 [Suillus brevipes Sb2]